MQQSLGKVGLFAACSLPEVPIGFHSQIEISLAPARSLGSRQSHKGNFKKDQCSPSVEKMRGTGGMFRSRRFAVGRFRQATPG